MINTFIISIGAELTKGEILNSNAVYISRELTKRGMDISSILVVPDNYKKAIRYIKRILNYGGLFIFTGGLGGTSDDNTRKIISSVLGKKLSIDKEKEEILREWYAKNERDFDESDIMQASCPEGGILLENHFGIAYGFYVKVRDKMIFSLPGVPKEMKFMFDNEVIPLLEKEKLFDHHYKSEIVTFCGIPEYTLDKRVKKILSSYRGIEHGTRAGFGLISLKLESWECDIEPCVAEIMETLDEYIVTRGNKRIEQVIGDLLKEKKITLSVAESCTAGLLSKVITDVPGSSKYFVGGIVSYSDRIKEDILGVSDKTLNKFGAVSSQTAQEMALGALKELDSDIAISITGIAGPNGGTKEKAVGTVYICIYRKGEKPYIKRNLFVGDRETIRYRSIYQALFMLVTFLRRHLN